MVARLRKAERLWPRWRWAVLGAGIFSWAIYGYIAFSVCDRLKSAEIRKDGLGYEIWLTGFAMIWPKCLLGFAVGACLIVFAIRDWPGSVNRTLLLKLLDAQEVHVEGRDQDAKTPNEGGLT